MTDTRFAPLRPPIRSASFAWAGRVVEVNLDTKAFNCPQCGMRVHIPCSLIAESAALATVSPSVVCPRQHGGCGSHVVIQRGNAL